MKDFDIRIRNGGDDAAGAVNELMAELQRRLLELQDSMPRWIPVSERMPQPGQQVLAAIPPRAWNEENQALMETLDYEQNGFYSWKDDEWTKGVTHWMPLPAQPTDAK